MKKLLVSIALLALSGLTLAHGCPGEIKSQNKCLTRQS